MKNIILNARDIPDAWFQVLQAIQQDGRIFTIDQGSYEGQKRKQLDFLLLRITHPFTMPMLPELPLHLSHIPPPANQEYLDDYVSYLMTDDIKKNEVYTYSSRIFGYTYMYDQGRHGIAGKIFGSTPINLLLNMLRNNKYTNQATLSIAKPEDISLEDPPCLRTLSFRYIENKLNMFVHFRSWDAWGGLPLNLAGLTYLFDYVASEVGLAPGELIATSEGCHIYDHCFSIVKDLVGL